MSRRARPCSAGYTRGRGRARRGGARRPRREPATANHIARKFARRFVSESATPELVEAARIVFRDTDGDLAALARALIDDAEAWSAPATKMRNPWELTVASYRAFQRSRRDPARR